MLASAARLAVRDGYPDLTVAAIVQDARVSDGVFFDAFPAGVQESFLAAYDRLGADVAAYAALADERLTAHAPKVGPETPVDRDR